MLARVLRWIGVGGGAGVAVLLLAERTPEGLDLLVAAGGVLLLVVALGLGRWRAARRGGQERRDDASRPR
ncbi:MAG: hypothetical protein AB1505_07105 [Candidatus Latescibacterota bacterium]